MQLGLKTHNPITAAPQARCRPYERVAAPAAQLFTGCSATPAIEAFSGLNDAFQCGIALIVRGSREARRVKMRRLGSAATGTMPLQPTIGCDFGFPPAALPAGFPIVMGVFFRPGHFWLPA